MTYLVNGVPLDNPGFGWRFRSASKPLADLSAELGGLSVRGRNGVLVDYSSVLSAPYVTLVVQTPRSHLRTLEVLFRSAQTLTSSYDPGVAVIEFSSLSPIGLSDADGIVDVSVTFRVPEAAARGAEVTSPPVSLTSASVDVTGLFPGLSADIQDVVVRVKGAVTGLYVSSPGGSWFSCSRPSTVSEYLRFEADTGRAFVTTTDTWEGGTEISGMVDYGGDRGVFELLPYWSADPDTRAATINVGTTGRASASIQVRGRPAFLV